jgi:hypothetical protein
MNPALIELITKASQFFGDPLPDYIILAHADALSDLPLNSVRMAYNEIAKTSTVRKTPLPGHIRAIINPSMSVAETLRADAVALSGRILEAVSKFGPYREKEARLFIGDTGWSAVGSFGGWQTICSITTEDVPSWRAQLREYCASLDAQLVYKTDKSKPVSLSSLGVKLPSLE